MAKEKKSATKTTREELPGQLRGETILELVEKMSRKPESRVDLQRALENLSPGGQTYARHLITSGASGNVAAAKACNFTAGELEKAMQEFETSLGIVRKY